MILPFVRKPEGKNGLTILQMEQTTMYCNNCGGKGHIFKSCKDPIISCGLILLTHPTIPVDPANVKLLMVRRKDSMAYTEFLRGKYELDDIEFIKKLLSNMTTAEHVKLQEETFDKLWTSHWGVGRDHHSQEYVSSKEKFAELNLTPLLLEIKSQYSESEWGFPKGRRHQKESDIDCAVREFSEETNIPRESYVVCKNLVLTETFNGTNNIKYKLVYFIALLRDQTSLNITEQLTYEQSREISAVEWKSINECRLLTRPHYIQRTQMLNNLEQILNSFDLQDNIVSW
jgi:8-oxo-dGTP pyrophosphatase MutT (NUDIX family)